MPNLRFPSRANAVAALFVLALLPFQAVAPVLAQNLPNLGDESANALPPQEERRIGESFYRDLRRDPAWLDDAEVSGYVQELGGRLVAVGPEPGMDVEFFVMRDGQVNAFAMLGGFIGVNTGLIVTAQSESELASVVGHEIGHLTQRHIARSVSAGQRTSLASMAAAALCLIAARSNPQGAGACLTGAQAAQVQAQLAYSRDFEREADRVGFDILRQGGFDVAAMPVFFERLQRATRLYDSNVPVYVRSHPLTTERIADVRNRVHGVPPSRPRGDTLAFHLVRAKLRATGETSAEGVRETLRFFESQVADPNQPQPAAAQFGLAYAHLQARDAKGAATAFARIPATLSHPMLVGLAARIRQLEGDLPGAATRLRAGIQKFPQARHLRFDLVEVLQAAGNHEEALALLRDQGQLYRADPRVYALQAKSFAATGQRVAQHQALGEQYVLLGSVPAAIEQFQIARCIGGADFYQQSIIDARIRTLWDSLLDERAGQQNAARRAPDGGRGPPSIAQGRPGGC